MGGVVDEGVVDVLVGVVDSVVLLGVEVIVVVIVVVVELAVLVGEDGEETEVLVEDAVDVGLVLAEVDDEVEALLGEELAEELAELLEALELEPVVTLVLTELEVVDSTVVEPELIELDAGLVLEGLPELDSVERLVDTTGEVLGLEEDMLLLPTVVVETPAVSVLTPPVLTPGVEAKLDVTPPVVTPPELNSGDAPELTTGVCGGVVNSGVKIVVDEGVENDSVLVGLTLDERVGVGVVRVPGDPAVGVVLVPRLELALVVYSTTFPGVVLLDDVVPDPVGVGLIDELLVGVGGLLVLGPAGVCPCLAGEGLLAVGVGGLEDEDVALAGV